MSVKVMGKVWDLDLPHNKLIVLLAMADHADHEGKNVFPSLGLIAWKTGYKVRQVRSIVKSLVEDEILIEISREIGKTVKYQIDLSKGRLKPEYTPAKIAPVQKLHPGKNDTPTPAKIAHDLCNSQAKNEHEPIKPSNNHQSAQPRNAMYDAIQQVWGYEAGRNGDVSNWLSGKKCKAQYKDYPIDPVVTPDELIAWSKDWRDKHPGIDMVESPAKVQDSILKWRRWKSESIQVGQRLQAQLETDMAINLAAKGIVLQRDNAL